MRAAAVLPLVLALGACHQAPPPPREAPILATQGAELRAARVDEHTFNLNVTLRTASATPVTLPMPVSSLEFRAPSEPVTAGDPLSPASVDAKLSGDENQAVATWLRPVRKKGQECVLAEQEFGFEVVKRNHTLICAVGEQARAVWKNEEIQGPSWSSVDIQDIDRDGNDELTLYTGFGAPEGPDTLDVTLLKWGDGKLNSSPATTRTVVAGTYPTVNAAREAKTLAGRADANCSKYFWVLAAEGNRFNLAAKTTLDAEALPLWKSWQACYPGIHMSK